jgi:hypothetical protein
MIMNRTTSSYSRHNYIILNMQSEHIIVIVIKCLIVDEQLPLEKPHLFSGSLRRSGVLLFGPPGLLLKFMADFNYLSN